MDKKERFNSKIASMTSKLELSFDSMQNLAKDAIILCASDDLGVRLNGGRAGARFAPKSIISQLKKFQKHPLKLQNIFTINLTSNEDSLESKQACYARSIKEAISKKPAKLVHLGGGHDHAYPLAKALIEKTNKNILIINIDAHLDTRIDQYNHSGTPFRNIDRFMKDSKNQVELIQIGIQDFANSISTQAPLENIKQSINPDLSRLKSKINKLDEQSLIYLSLDCDAISAHELPAVSALNPDGLSIKDVKQILQLCKKAKSKSVFGIYELNPLYDNKSAASAKSIANLIYQFLLED